LGSYDAERQPVGRQIVARANKSFLQNNAIWDLLGGGTLADLAPEDHAAAFDTNAGRRSLREAVAQFRYEYHAHGVEMNRRYCSDAVAPDGASEPAPARDPELYYQPTTWPGATLPHAWLCRLSPGPRVSTLDIAGKGRFCLLIGHGGDAWRDAAAHLAARTGVEIAVVSIGPRLDYEDPYGRWRDLSEVEEDGCVLVRPDLIIGWRSVSTSPAPERRLGEVLARILDRPELAMETAA
jgi:2,4-dichlorophenol 6-monooxygenase